MAVNSSSNDSLLHLNIRPDIYCLLIAKPSSFIFTSFTITTILLLLPLCILVIYLGLQRWRQQRSTSAAAAVTSHSDSFTYHMVTMELIAVFGCTLNCCSIYRDSVNIFYVGFSLWYFSWNGEQFFHILTCVERYLAVVHPITYLSLRGERGIRIRNISIGCVWLLCCVTTGLTSLTIVAWMDFSLTLFSFVTICFCSLSVLCVLIRPGPGEQGGNRKRVDQSKRRAFYTTLAILGALLMKFSGNLVITTFYIFRESIGCVLMVSEIWFNLPCSLVLPLLFLHRAGTFVCHKNNAK